jgi:antitoxin CptB
MLTPERKAKINWHCRRGMLELDLILEKFSKKHLETLSEQDLVSFESLLTSPDPDLYAWFMGYESPMNRELMDIVDLIRHQDNF